jgi:hypothetical protein
MYTSLGMAAKAAGVSKSTVLRAIMSHRISASRTDTGDWQIDPAELHRVFPSERAVERTAARGATAVQRLAQRGAAEHDALQAQIAGLREVAELLRRQLEDVRADRDAWREQAQAGQRLLAPADCKPWWRRIVG